MKKIALYIDTMYYGGAQRVMSIIANYFSDNNYNVILITEIPYVTNDNVYKISSNIKIISLDDRKINNFIFRQLCRLKKLRKILRDEKPDIILSFLARPNIRMLLSTIGLNIKKVVSVRNDPYKEYGHGIRKIIINILFKLADGCVFQTKEAATYFTKEVINKSTIIRNPVSSKFYNVNSDRSNKTIIFVGRLESQKNPNLLIEAFKKISVLFNEWNLLIVGDGSMRDTLEKRVALLGLTNKVNFIGQINNIEEILKRVSIYVLCSNYEGMPNALMEAMASGVACISTDCPCGGPRELIVNKKDGLLIPINNEEKLIQALVTLIKDERLRDLYAYNSKIKALEFHSDVVLKEWEHYLTE